MVDAVKKYFDLVKAFESLEPDEIEAFRISYLGKKGILNSLFSDFRKVPLKEKKSFGIELNKLKTAVLEKVRDLKEVSKKKSGSNKISDPTRSAFKMNTGSKHPLSIVKNRIVDIFTQIGFSVSEGPEIEDDWHNFTALNLPYHHPARDMQDTFFIETNPDILLRTHTSSVQVRYMENNQPPIRTISPGRVFRNEAI